HLVDPGSFRLFSYLLSNGLRGLDIQLGFLVAFGRGGGGQRMALCIVDDLGIDGLVAPEHGEAGTLRGAVNIPANALLDPLSAFNFILQWHNSIFRLRSILFSSSLTSLPAYIFSDIAD